MIRSITASRRHGGVLSQICCYHSHRPQGRRCRQLRRRRLHLVPLEPGRLLQPALDLDRSSGHDPARGLSAEPAHLGDSVQPAGPPELRRRPLSPGLRQRRLHLHPPGPRHSATVRAASPVSPATVQCTCLLRIARARAQGARASRVRADPPMTGCTGRPMWAEARQ